MIVAIHQPNYLPYFGTFHKMAQVEVFVLFDNVPVEQGKSWTSRNRINLNGKETWLTVPIMKKGRSGQLIKDVEISWDTPWARKHLKTIQAAYRGSPYLEEVVALLQRAVDRAPGRLVDLNCELIEGLADMLGIRCSFARASERVDSDSRGTALISEICQAFGCTEYVGGAGYSDFEPDELERAGIRVRIQSFDPPTYESAGGRFLPNLSVLDAILSVGPQQTGRWLSEVAVALPE